MDVLMVILRLIHIFAGIIWVGSTFLFVGILTPTVRKLGPDGGKFMQALLLQSSYAVVIPVVAILTTLSGVLMFFRISGNLNSAWFGSSPGIVLSIGALAGLLAAGHGLAVIVPLVRKMQSHLRAMAAAGGPPSDEQMSALRAMQARMGTNSLIIAVLMIISVAGMSSFRYF